jgi:hypothetical protein
LPVSQVHEEKLLETHSKEFGATSFPVFIQKKIEFQYSAKISLSDVKVILRSKGMILGGGTKESKPLLKLLFA